MNGRSEKTSTLQKSELGQRISPPKLRADAARRLHSVLDTKQQKSLDVVLNPPLENAQQQAWLAAALYGACRFMDRYQSQISIRLRKPFKTKDAILESLLILGMHQLSEMQLKSHAAINETVNACQVLNKPWAKGLVNAVLRGYQRDLKDGLEFSHEREIYSHPLWLIDRLKQDWPHDWQKILTANNNQAPMYLRVNCARWGRQQALEALGDNGISAKASTSVDSAIILEQAVEVKAIPQFNEGYFSVQDGSAQLAASILLTDKDRQRDLAILDACAAPGGKTGHLLERMSLTSALTAVEKYANRAELIKDNIRRIGLDDKQIDIQISDIQDFAQTAAKRYDCILADVPCTASGVIRRHPDIKIKRTEKQLQAIVVEQKQILESLWSCLKVRGRLLYATCSVIADENHEQIKSFLATHADAKMIPLTIAEAVDTGFGMQIFPGSDDRDGFFYALLEKQE